MDRETFLESGEELVRRIRASSVTPASWTVHWRAPGGGFIDLRVPVDLSEKFTRPDARGGGGQAAEEWGLAAESSSLSTDDPAAAAPSALGGHGSLVVQVVWDEALSAPALFFRLLRADDTIVPAKETWSWLYGDLGSDTLTGHSADAILHRVVLSQAENPVDGSIWHHVHGCDDAARLRLLLGSEEASQSPLLAWFASHLPLVRIQVPPALFLELTEP